MTEENRNKLMAARIDNSKNKDGVIAHVDAIITDSFGLDGYKYIIMVVTPVNEKGKFDPNDLIATPASTEIKKTQ